MPPETTGSQVKNWVGYALVFALVVGGMSALWYAHTYSRATEPSSFRSFSVSAEGKAVVVPDIGVPQSRGILPGGTGVDSRCDFGNSSGGPGGKMPARYGSQDGCRYQQLEIHRTHRATQEQA